MTFQMLTVDPRTRDSQIEGMRAVARRMGAPIRIRRYPDAREIAVATPHEVLVQIICERWS